MIVDFAYRPLPVHEPFHTSYAYERALAGAMGSGKSYAVCAEAIAWCLEQPGIRGMVTRKTIPSLRDSTESVFFDLLPHELYKAGEVRKSGGHVDRFIFPNGSIVLFRSMDDFMKHKSLNLGFIAWDEADQNTEEEYLFMLSRLRQRDLTAEAKARGYEGEITRRGTWMAFNPEGHNWIYQRFVNRNSKSYRDGSEWFRSTSFDNPYLPLEYIENLLQMPEPWIKRYVLCQFDDFAGQIYEGWNWDDHVIEPIDVAKYPQGAVFWHGVDPGTRNPTAGLWVVQDPANRRLIGIAEYEEAGLSSIVHANAWRAIEAKKRMKVSWRTADPNIMTRDRGTNMTLYDQYRRLGYVFNLGPREHKVRIPALGQLISQKRFVVTKECMRAYEEIREYRWEDLTPAQRDKGLDPKEQPLKKDDHLVDCAQYLASRWVKPRRVEQSLEDPNSFEQFSHEAQRAIRKQLMRKQRMARMPKAHDLGGIRV